MGLQKNEMVQPFQKLMDQQFFIPTSMVEDYNS